jgi:hypothetical protein
MYRNSREPGNSGDSNGIKAISFISRLALVDLDGTNNKFSVPV